MTSWTTLEAFEEELLKDRDFRREHEVLALEYQIARLILATRLSMGLSQQALAEAIGTTQTRISKWERGQELPRLDALLRVAEATGFELQIGLVPQSSVVTSRKRTGSKKAAQRSSAARRKKVVRSAGRKAATEQSATKQSTGRKTSSARKISSRKVAARKSTGQSSTSRKSAGRKK